MEEEWTSFALTHVEYPKGDLLGQVLAIISLLPLAILCGFTTLVLFRRDLHTITFLIGQLTNEAINVVLKKAIRQPRPMRRETNYTEWGMPSSHSQFMTFFAVYSAMFILFRLRAAKSWHKMGLFLLTLTTAALVLFSRIYLRYHTPAQVGWGVAVGAGFALFWFLITHYIFTPWFPEIANLWICEFLLIRDTTLIPNVLWFEYQNARLESRTRARAKKSSSKTK